jgi:hypothetical protein
MAPNLPAVLAMLSDTYTSATRLVQAIQIELAATDYVEMVAYHTASGTLTVVSNPELVCFEALWIGGPTV